MHMNIKDIQKEIVDLKEEQIEKTKKLYKCPQGHDLQLIEGWSHSNCSHCDKPFLNGQQIYECYECAPVYRLHKANCFEAAAKSYNKSYVLHKFQMNECNLRIFNKVVTLMKNKVKIEAKHRKGKLLIIKEKPLPEEEVEICQNVEYMDPLISYPGYYGLAAKEQYQIIKETIETNIQKKKQNQSHIYKQVEQVPDSQETSQMEKMLEQEAGNVFYLSRCFKNILIKIDGLKS